MTNYSLSSLQNLINKYIEEGGEAYELQEGVLGLGLVVCRLEGYKSAVIREYYINCWTSGHTCRFYNKLPKKYEVMIDEQIICD